MKTLMTIYSAELNSFIVNTLTTSGFNTLATTKAFGAAATRNGHSRPFNQIFVDTVTKTAISFRGGMSSGLAKEFNAEHNDVKRVEFDNEVVEYNGTTIQIHTLTNSTFYVYGKTIDTSYSSANHNYKGSKFVAEGSTNSLEVLEAKLNFNLADTIKLNCATSKLAESVAKWDVVQKFTTDYRLGMGTSKEVVVYNLTWKEAMKQKNMMNLYHLDDCTECFYIEQSL